MESLRQKARFVTGFKPDGVQFLDVGDLFEDAELFHSTTKYLATAIQKTYGHNIKLAVLESKGFALGAAIAAHFPLGVPIVMVRKQGALPGECERVSYTTEYSSDTLEIQRSRVHAGDRFVVVDDVKATSGTLRASTKAIRAAGGNVVCWAVAYDVSARCSTCARIVDENDPPTVSACAFDGAVPDEAVFIKPAPLTWLPYEVPAPDAVPCRNRTAIDARKTASKQRVLVMAHPTMGEAANALCDQYGDHYEMSYVTWDHFEYSWPNIQFAAGGLENRDVLFMCSLLAPGHWVEIISLLIAVSRQGINSLTISAPFFPASTNEVVVRPGYVATAETALRMLSASLPATKTGPSRIVFFDLHANVERFYSTDSLVVVPADLSSLFRTEFGSSDGSRCVCFPDQGAYKRLRYVLGDLPAVICEKFRGDGDERTVRIVDRRNFPTDARFRDAPLQHVWIVDDLVRTGGSIHECAKALRAAGAQHVSCFVTHAVFAGDSFRQFANGGAKAGLDHFVVTDSVPEVSRKLVNLPPFKVVSTTAAIASIMRAGTAVPSQTRTHVLVCSASRPKLEAVGAIFNHARISYTAETLSSVPAQPVGYEQIKLGAKTRLEHAVLASNIVGERCVIAVESGLVLLQNGVLQEAVGVASTLLGDRNSGKTAFHITYTDLDLSFVHRELGVASSDVIAALLARAPTLGRYLEQTRGYQHDDWYHHIDPQRRTRRQYIQDALLPVRWQSWPKDLFASD